MKKRLVSLISALALLVAAITTWQVWPGSSSGISVAPSAAYTNQSWGPLPLSFEANEGQTDSQVEFLARGQGYTLYLKPTEAVLSLTKSSAVPQIPDLATANDGTLESSGPKAEPPTVLSMQLVGANASAKVMGRGSLPPRQTG